jgi:hypothetical protein
MPGDPGATVVTNARATYSTRAATGATGTRHSPRPPFRGGRFWQQLGHIMPRERGRILRRHHPRKRMIQYSETSVMGSRVAAYWIPAFAGMTACCGAPQCFAEPVIGLSGGETRRRVQRFGGAVFPCAKAGAFAVQRQRQSGEQTGDVRCISLWTSIKLEAENL